jgi:hypothetical protein
MSSLLELLQSLEVELHRPGVRMSRSRLELLLHPEFHEVGRSGRQYDRETIIAFLASRAQHPEVESGGFGLKELGPSGALLTYWSAQRASSGTLSDHALRSSLWVQGPAGWQLLYHQGTPAAEAQ